MKKQTLLAALLTGAALNLTTGAFAADRIERVPGRESNRAYRVGKIEKANDLIGRNVVNRQDEKIGDVSDFVVDLESGRILYTLVSSGGFLGVGDHQSAVPAQMLRASADGQNELVLDVNKEKLKGAPRFNNERAENLNNAGYVREVYSYYDRPIGWLRGDEVKLKNVQRASKLLKAEVNNNAGERIGRIANMATDIGSGRVVYVVLNPTRALDEGGHLYAVPPMTLKPAQDDGKFIAEFDEKRLATAPKFQPGNWQEITAPSYAGNVYQFYSKQLYTENDEVLRGARADTEEQTREARREARDRQAERRDAQAGKTASAGDNAFGPIIGAEALMGWQVQAPGGGKLGTLKDLVFDLESGRLLYGVVDDAGLGVAGRDNYAVAPSAFRRINEANKVIVADFGARKLADAPAMPRNREEYIAPSFVGNIYRFYGEQPWWTDRTPEPTGRDANAGKFGNVHRASDLIGMKVQNVNGEDLGRVHNVMVDLPDGRIGYVLLAPRTAGRDADGFIALPPMAVTVNSDGKTLTTNLEGDKLQTAPRITRNELSKLDDASFAANVYRFYGKDTWWRGTATGRE